MRRPARHGLLVFAAFLTCLTVWISWSPVAARGLCGGVPGLTDSQAVDSSAVVPPLPHTAPRTDPEPLAGSEE